MKKLMIGLAPLLAVAAFAVMPAMASAATTYGTCETGGVEEHPPCPAGEKKFTAFTAATEVISEKALGTGNFVLKSGTAVIECETFIDSGSDENVSGVGKSTDKLIFNHCFFVFETKKCPVGTAGAGSGVIFVSATDKVKSETEVEITLPTAVTVVFSGPPPAGCPAAGTEIGKITGSIVGKQAAGTNILVFNKTAGLLFNGAASELTGSDETYTKNTGKPVVI